MHPHVLDDYAARHKQTDTRLEKLNQIHNLPVCSDNYNYTH